MSIAILAKPHVMKPHIHTACKFGTKQMVALTRLSLRSEDDHECTRVCLVPKQHGKKKQRSCSWVVAALHVFLFPFVPSYDTRAFMLVVEGNTFRGTKDARVHLLDQTPGLGQTNVDTKCHIQANSSVGVQQVYRTHILGLEFRQHLVKGVLVDCP